MIWLGLLFQLIAIGVAADNLIDIRSRRQLWISILLAAMGLALFSAALIQI